MVEFCNKCGGEIRMEQNIPTCAFCGSIIFSENSLHTNDDTQIQRQKQPFTVLEDDVKKLEYSNDADYLREKK